MRKMLLAPARSCECGVVCVVFFCVDIKVLLDQYRLPPDPTQNKIPGPSLIIVLYAM